MSKHKSNKIKENSNTVRHLIMGQIITTQNLVAIKVVRHAGRWTPTDPWVKVACGANIWPWLLEHLRLYFKPCSCYIVIVNSLILELVLFVPADQLALCLHRVRCDCTTLNVFADNVPWLYMVFGAFPQIKRHWSNTIRDPVKSHSTARMPRVGIWWRVLFTFPMLQF